MPHADSAFFATSFPLHYFARCRPRLVAAALSSADVISPPTPPRHLVAAMLRKSVVYDFAAPLIAADAPCLLFERLLSRAAVDFAPYDARAL